VIDIHSHILPEVDDGPKSWQTAEAMCRMATQDGIEHMVATPHANDRYFYDRDYLADLLSKLQLRIGARPLLNLGCDFHLSFENMQNAMQTPERYCIGKTRYLLVERNPILQKSLERVVRWAELGCAVQITASVLTGSWGERAGESAQWLLKKKAVHFLATDAHDLVRRPPILSEARKVLAKNYGEQTAHALVESNPGAVIRNEPLAKSGG
jgi:protein-tyrosine phosphatase